MARKEIKNPMDDSALNSTNHNFIELYDGVQDASGKINKVEKDINDRMDNFIDETSEEALWKVVNNAKINWEDPVDNFSDLPSNAEEGDTRMDRSTGKVYRYNGTEWKEIQQIDAGPVNELDSRLSSQLAETEKELMPYILKINDRDSAIRYVGNWRESNNNNFYKGTLKSSSKNGAYLEFDFVGTGVRLYTAKLNDSGKAEVYIDDISYGVIDLYNNSAIYNAKVFEKLDLENKEHTVKLIVLGERSSSSSSNAVRIDYFEVVNENRINAEIKNLNNIKNYNINAKSPLYIPTYDNAGQAIHPKVLYFPNHWNGYKYWMAFTPYTNSDIKTENPSIVASNVDGYGWAEPRGINNPISGIPNDARYGYYSDPTLLMRGNTMEMWYRYNPPNANDTDTDRYTNIIYRQTSTDGINWSNKEIMVQATNNQNLVYVCPTVIWENNKYKMWYHDYRGGMFYKESADGKNWTTEQVLSFYLPLPYWTWHSDIIKDGNKYLMVVSCDTSVGSGNRYELFYGESDDGLDFGELKRILEPSDNSAAFDNKRIYRASILKTDDKIKLFYSAMNSEGKWATGLTEGKTIDSLVGYDNEYFVKYLPNGARVPHNVDFTVGDARIYYDEGLDRLIIYRASSFELASEEGSLRITKSGVGTGYLDYDGLHFQSDRNGSYYKDGKAKFQVTGKGSVIVKFEEDPYSLALRNADDTKYRNMSVGGLYLHHNEGTGVVNREGAIRYNSDTKKMQYHDGNGWKSFAIE